MRRRPYSVILLDEIEKAHPDVFNVLLQILEDGRLTDGKGRTVDFRNARDHHDFRTSAPRQSSSWPGKDPKKARQEAMSALREIFRPEFLNRIDDIVLFSPLGKDQIERSNRYAVERILEALGERQVTLRLTPAAKTLALPRRIRPGVRRAADEAGYSAALQDPLALKILDGEVKPGESDCGRRPKERGNEIRTMRPLRRAPPEKAPGTLIMKTFKTALLLTTMTLLLLFMGEAFGGRNGVDHRLLALPIMMNGGSLFFLGQDRPDFERRASRSAGASASALRRDGAPCRESESARPESSI